MVIQLSEITKPLYPCISFGTGKTIFEEQEDTFCSVHYQKCSRHTMTVLEFPPSESWSSLVSLEFLYGIWVLLPSTNAEITFPRVERDRLICVASFSLCPVAPVFACLSDPLIHKRQIKVPQLSQNVSGTYNLYLSNCQICVFYSLKQET